LLLLQESFDGSTLETTNVLSPWSIFIPELLPLLEPLLELPLALWSEAGMLPVEAVLLPVPLAPEAVVSAVGVLPDALPPAVVLPALPLPDALPPEVLPVPVLALPLAPGVLSLIAPPLEDPDPLLLGVVELIVELFPLPVVVVVVVVVWLEALVEPLPLDEPLMPELLLLPLLEAPLCQSPRSLTALPTCAERSCVLERLELAILLLQHVVAALLHDAAFDRFPAAVRAGGAGSA